MTHNYYVKDCLNRSIRNHQGNSLGHVEDMVLNPKGRAEYIIISFGGVFGTEFHDKRIAVPYDQFGWNAEKGCLELPLRKQTLEAAPNFDKNQVPSLEEPHQYFLKSSEYYTNVA